MVVNDVRQACEELALRARRVSIHREQIALYAASLPDSAPPQEPLLDDLELRRSSADYWLTLDTINFGSGWFPTLRKRPGRTGYSTVAGGLRRHFDAAGAWSATELQALDEAALAEVLDQDPEHELVALWVRSLRDLGAHLQAGYGGDSLALIASAHGSAAQLVDTLAEWDCFSDVASYEDLSVPFFKRAQIVAADLARAGAAHFHDLASLTMFADNLVPHVLRLDGILSFDSELVARIDREDLIEHGSPEEVEIRGCAVHAVELIVAASPQPTTAAQIDQLLWLRGQDRLYKSAPRHRSRSTAY